MNPIDVEDTPPMGNMPQHGYNAENTDQIEVATIQSKRRDQQEFIDLSNVMSTPSGRRFMTRILQLTGIQRLSELDPIACQRSEGARSVGIELLKILHGHSIHLYPQLLIEAAQQAEEEHKEREIALNERERAQKPKVMDWLKNRFVK